MAILTTAFAVGANTAVFGVVRAVFLRPLGFPDEGRLVEIRDCNQRERQRREARGQRSSFDSRGCISVSGGLYQDFTTQSKSYDALGASTSVAELLPIAASGEPALVHGYRLTRSALEALGVQPIQGRLLDGQGEVVLSWRVWKALFQGDPTALGRKVSIAESPYEIVGIMPPDFAYPPGAEVWLAHPFGTSGYRAQYSSRNLKIIGRLRRGVTIEAAQAEATALSARAAAVNPKANAGWSTHIDGLLGEMTFAHRRAFVILGAAVGIVLLIACANLSSLFVAGLESRAVEMSVRVAMGATRARLFRQVLVECVTLTAVGGALGILFADWGLALLRPLIPAGLPRVEEIRVDWVVAVFSLVISALTGAVIAILPGLRAADTKIAGRLRLGPGRTTARGGLAFRNALVSAQVALCVVLLAGAGLLFNTLRRLAEQEVGFRPDHLVVANAPLSGAHFRDPARRVAFTADVISELHQYPNLATAAAGYPLPFTGDQQGTSGMTVQGRGEIDLGTIQTRQVTPEYFATLSIPLLSGRLFSETDSESSPKVCIINRTLARAAFPDGDPIGRKVNDTTIVGVVGDVRQLGIDHESGPEFYVPWTQDSLQRRITFAVRYRGSEADAAAALRAGIHRVDPIEPLDGLATMEILITRSTSDRRFSLVLFSIFSIVALGIAAVGIYGVVSHAVTARTQEIGIRFALGAGRRAVVTLVLGQGLAPVALGLAAGLGLALLTTRYLTSVIYGVAPHDPGTLSAACLVLLLVAVAASLGPSVRACQTDPADALRAM